MTTSELPPVRVLKVKYRQALGLERDRGRPDLEEILNRKWIQGYVPISIVLQDNLFIVVVVLNPPVTAMAEDDGTLDDEDAAEDEPGESYESDEDVDETDTEAEAKALAQKLAEQAAERRKRARAHQRAKKEANEKYGKFAVENGGGTELGEPEVITT